MAEENKIKYVWVKGNKPRFLWHLLDKTSPVHMLSFPTKRRALCNRFLGDLEKSVSEVPENRDRCARCDRIWREELRPHPPLLDPPEPSKLPEPSEPSTRRTVPKKVVDELMRSFGELFNEIVEEAVQKRTKDLQKLCEEGLREIERKKTSTFAVPGTINLLQAMSKDASTCSHWPQLKQVLERVKASKKSESD